MENAQALAATAAFANESLHAWPASPGPKQYLVCKNTCAATNVRTTLDAVQLWRVYAKLSANITNVGDSREGSPLRVPSLDLAREYSVIGPMLLQAVEQVFSSQNFIMGAQVAEFEQAAAKKCGALQAVGCSSGTDALWLALSGAGIGPGDVVVTTAFSFFATASAILRTGARPVLADIDPETFNLDPLAVGNYLASSRAAAILPVHLYGQTVDWDCFSRLRQDHSLLLIEDAAQAFGACWDGRPAGSLGDAAAFSFYPTKNLSAGGDAGMVTTSVDSIAVRVRLLHNHGMRQRYQHDEVGWNSRMDTVQAAVLMVKLAFIDEWNRLRRSLAENYAKLFAQAGLVESGIYPQHGLVLPRTRSKATHVFHQYVVRVRRRDALKSFLRERGIGSEIYYPLALHQQPALSALGYANGSFPESERAAAEVLALPMFPQLTFAEQELVVSAIAEFLT